MNIGTLLGQNGGEVVTDGALTEKNFSCAQAITDVVITSIEQPDFAGAAAELAGVTVTAGDFIYGGITEITFTGTLKLFASTIPRS